MFGFEKSDEKDIENDKKENKELDSFANNLKSEFSRNENNETKASNGDNKDVVLVNAGFACPDRILDFLEDKPYVILDFVLFSAQKATKDEVKEIYDNFPISDADKKLSRAFVKEQIEAFVAKNPELGKYFSDENLFYLRLITRELEVHSALKNIRKRKEVELQK